MAFQEKKRWLFFGLPFTFTKYTVEEEVITINSGLLHTHENDCYMYKVQDVTLVRGLFERIFGLGTVICYSSDVTDSKLMLTHIRNSSEVKESPWRMLPLPHLGQIKQAVPAVCLAAMPQWGQTTVRVPVSCCAPM